MRRILVACVGNVLRRDDGFGVAVARELERRQLPAELDLIETGIGGMSVVQQLLDGYDALIVVDAIEGEGPPGTVRTLRPVVPDPAGLAGDRWRALFANLHLAEPHRILLLARSLGALPPEAWMVGCVPLDCDTMDEQLSPEVRAAVPRAADEVLSLADRLLAAVPR